MAFQGHFGLFWLYLAIQRHFSEQNKKKLKTRISEFPVRRKTRVKFSMLDLQGEEKQQERETGQKKN